MSEETGDSRAIYEEALYAGKVSDEEKFLWIFVSGASQHMRHDKNSRSDFIEFRQPCTIILDDTHTIHAFGKGLIG